MSFLFRYTKFARKLHYTAKRLNKGIPSTPAHFTSDVRNGNYTDDLPGNLMNKLPEELISEGSGLKSTTAENQLDTLKYYNELLQSGFTPKQSTKVIELLLQTLDEEFFGKYNEKFLRKMELDNQSHLFNAAETELKYAIQISRETSLNEQNLKLLKLNRDVHLMHEELNELIINLLTKDSRVDFNDHKIENTLLHRNINLTLKDSNHKIGTRIIGNIKSEIENLRWQTTRSGLFAVLVLVFFVMSGVSISRRIASDHDKPVEVVLHTIEPEEHSENKEEQLLLDGEDRQ